MQETSNTDPNATSYQTSTPSPMSGTVKKGPNKWLWIFLGLLVLGGVGVFFFTKNRATPTPTATPSFGVIPVDEETETPSPSPVAEPVDKAKIAIEIQNGTGITGEAGFLQTKLKALGYSDIKVGNADNTSYTDTMVTFKKDTQQAVQDELKKELETIYKKVVIKTSTSQTVNVLIITGLRSGSTAKPTSKATSIGSPKGTATAKPSGSGTATKSPSPTPTATPIQ